MIEYLHFNGNSFNMRTIDGDALSNSHPLYCSHFLDKIMILKKFEAKIGY